MTTKESGEQEVEIEVDREKCAGWGYCADAAPNTFDLVGNFVAVKEGSGRDDPDRLQAAVRACPMRAIRLRQTRRSA